MKNLLPVVLAFLSLATITQAFGQVARGPFPNGSMREMQNGIVCHKTSINDGDVEGAIEATTYKLNEKIDGVVSATTGERDEEYRLNSIHIILPGRIIIGQKIKLPVQITGHTVTVTKKAVVVCASVSGTLKGSL